MSDDFTLRTGPDLGSETPPVQGGGLRRGEVPEVNASAELLADLLAATGLIPEDKLALARGRLHAFSMSEQTDKGRIKWTRRLTPAGGASELAPVGRRRGDCGACDGRGI